MENFSSPGEAAIGRAAAYGRHLQLQAASHAQKQQGHLSDQQFGGANTPEETGEPAAASGAVVSSSKVLPEFAEATAAFL